MSICIYARINKKSIDKIALERVLNEFFLPQKNIVIHKEKYCLTYENVFEDDSVVISFVSEKKPPYNIYDSSLCDGEFEYTQLVIFDIKKGESSIDKYKRIIDFCIYLKKNLSGDILVTSDAHSEICLLKEEDLIWGQNFSFS